MISPYLRLPIAEAPRVNAVRPDFCADWSNNNPLLHDESDYGKSEVMRKSAWQALLMGSMKRALRSYRKVDFSDDEVYDITAVPVSTFVDLINEAFEESISAVPAACQLLLDVTHNDDVNAVKDFPVRQAGRDGIRSAAVTILAAETIARDHLPMGRRRSFVAKSYRFVSDWAQLAHDTDSLVPYLLGPKGVAENYMQTGVPLADYRLDPAKLEPHKDGCLAVRADAYDGTPDEMKYYLTATNEGAGCPMLPYIPAIYMSLMRLRTRIITDIY